MADVAQDFPPWQTVYDHFSRWNKRGIWEAALDQLNARHRKKNTGLPSPATASSIRKASKPNMTVTSGGINGGKKAKGRKRHLVVDLLSNLLHIRVHAANLHNTVSGCNPAPYGGKAPQP